MVRDWDTVSDGALSEASIRSRLSHPERYRVSTYRYPPGTSLSGSGRAGLAYVLAGECRYRVSGTDVRICERQFADIPEGPFEFETGTEPVELVRVWLLPEAFWGSGSGT
jgi:hypothetical protein